MDRNVVRFGLVAVIILVIFAAAEIYPPNETLKPGLDLAGGTSLTYDIDTTGLRENETDSLSQKLVPILMKRIDPGNIQNIIMRPQGDTRIEIQVPLASADTYRKRQAYDDALNALEKDNINLAIIKRTLVKDPNDRAAIFAEFAADSNERKEILSNLASTYDARKAAQEKRDNYKLQLDTIAGQLEKARVNKETLAMLAPSWDAMDPNEQKATVDRLVADVNGTDNKPAAKSTAEQTKEKLLSIEQYFALYRQWADVVNELTMPETGLNTAYRDAELRLKDFNLGTETLTEVLEMPEKSRTRAEFIKQFKNRFPSRVDRIDTLVKAFGEYRPMRGRIDGPEDVKRMLKGSGVLEFRILPTLNDGRTNRDELLAYTDALKTKGPKLASDSKYIWLELENPKDSTWQSSDSHQIITGTFAEKYYVLASNLKDECMLKNTGKKPWKLQKAGTTVDELGKRAISFTFDEVAASLFYNLTRNNLQRPLCITLDNIAISAPNIRSAIRSSGIIEGSYTQTEQMDMIDKLNAGSLPARLIEPPVSEKTIGPSLGADNRNMGIQAGKIALAVVMCFMILYYRISGIIACIALGLNILFILAMMAITRATFTMGGIAGIVLTIGMSVDANILIFERLREELDGGAGIRTAISNGFSRAFLTIFDSNLTTFIPALILYMIASEEIKGFAITLMFGIISSLFTAIFVTRIIFHILLNMGIIHDKLTMMRIIRNANVNWMGLRPVFITASLLLVAGGLFVFFYRDEAANSKYDIEFTGGTSLQINLKSDNPLERSEVENIIRMEGKRLNNPGIAMAKVYRVGDKTSQLQYEITTTETNKTTVPIVFNAGQNQTVQSVTDAITKTQKTMRGILSSLAVTQDSNNPLEFVIATTQTNTPIVTRILNKTFGENAVAGEPVVNEIVTGAVQDAFAGKLEMLENLEPNIASVTKIDNATVDAYPELSDFLGGVKIEFTVQKPVMVSQIVQRLNDLRYKPELTHIQWFQYRLTGPTLESLPDKPYTTFVYYSVEPEAGFRQFNEDEWKQFVNNETTKLTEAASLQSSLPRVTQIAPSIGDEAKTRAIVATVLSLIAICIYVWFRFGTLRYGVAAIVPIGHDICITIGAVVACTYIAGTVIGQKLLIGDFKIDLAMIAAFLTIIGYSINDTIVVFDRIRERRGRLSILTPELISQSINQTLSRTILTSFTTFLAVLILYILGGPAIRGFAFAMLIGVVIGTYSSIAIAAPILILGKKTKAVIDKK
ncbi:MAG: protein translocase subunit SecD [Phycisphaerae bacterium]|jgi:SecD/SecF fusion protein